MSDSDKPADDIDHSQDEVVENPDEGQKEYNATTTIHHAEVPEGVTPADPYTQQEQNAPQTDAPQVDEEGKPLEDGDDAEDSGDESENQE